MQYNSAPQRLGGHAAGMRSQFKTQVKKERSNLGGPGGRGGAAGLGASTDTTKKMGQMKQGIVGRKMRARSPRRPLGY